MVAVLGDAGSMQVKRCSPHGLTKVSTFKWGGTGEPRSKEGEVEGKRLRSRISKVAETGKSRKNI